MTMFQVKTDVRYLKKTIVYIPPHTPHLSSSELQTILSAAIGFDKIKISRYIMYWQ